MNFQAHWASTLRSIVVKFLEKIAEYGYGQGQEDLRSEKPYRSTKFNEVTLTLSFKIEYFESGDKSYQHRSLINFMA